MGLRDASIKRLYFLDSEHPYYFYQEIYNSSKNILIALGYFSGSAFGLGIDGLLNFVKNGEKIKILCNDKLFKPDLDAIREGYEFREDRKIKIDDFFALINEADSYEKFGFKCLSYLIALDRLDIKILRSSGLVHFKIGVAIDENDDMISFEGSVNYTISGLMHNNEQLHTTCSWKDDEDYEFVDSIYKKINRLWGKKNKDFEVIDGELLKNFLNNTFPVRDLNDLYVEFETLKNDILRNTLCLRNNPQLNRAVFFKFPEEYKIRDYQFEAIKNWEKNNYKSLFAMATGTGKTLTALFAVNSLSFSLPDLTYILIIVPLRDLIDQWDADLKSIFDGSVIKIHGGNRRWLDELKSIKIRNFSGRNPSVIICTYQSYAKHKDTIISQLFLHKSLIIADEVHRFGSEGLRSLLPEEIKYRIGLSATPKREYDEEGTNVIFDYFCEHNDPFVVDIKKAIEMEVLCPYFYYPIFVELTEKELREYSTISERIRRIIISSEDIKKNNLENKSLTLLLKRRHRIIEQAENKISAFRDLIENLEKSKNSVHKAIVYVPEGTNDGEELINHYSRILWHEFQISNSKYVQGANKQLLDDFKNDLIRVLVAKKRLDEGVNIPQIRKAFFISSSTAEREFVQRRGRVLRKAEGKDYAEIFDFLVVPPKYFDIQLLDSDIKSIIKNELKRAESFASNAKNKYKALRLIEKEFDYL